MNDSDHPTDIALRRVVAVVALLNFAYFFVEFTVARSIGSVALFADSIDFLEDTAVNLLIVFALGWSLIWRARVGMLLSAFLLVPAAATLWTAWEKLNEPMIPNVTAMSTTGAGALVVNLFCAYLLLRFRHKSGSLTKAAFLSARNDAFANIAIIATGLVTAFLWRSGWPDLIVGLGIAAMNADAAFAVLKAARQEDIDATNAAA